MSHHVPILEPAEPLKETVAFNAAGDVDVVIAKLVEKSDWTRSIPRAIASGAGWIFGAMTLIAGLAVLAAIPIAQFLSLGYLLEASGRVARTGRLRDGFIGVRLAARLGGIVLGAWLVLLPVRFVASLARSAQLIQPDGPVAVRWRTALTVVTVLALAHIVAACSRGGKLRYFLWPFTNPFWLVRRLWRGGYFAEARDAVWNTMISLRLPYYFSVGLRGFFGTLAWLVIPVTLMALGHKVPVLGFLGAFALGIVVLYLPFLQARFAAANRLRALFELRGIRAGFRRAPLAYTVALLMTLVLAVPLYLLKIEMVPREAAWLPSAFFISFMFPARLATGWAYGYSQRRPVNRHWLLRLTARLAMLPAAAFYVLIVFFSQYTAWEGVASLYEQHAFLLPVPFMGM
jgi:hypothetical protein